MIRGWRCGGASKVFWGCRRSVSTDGKATTKGTESYYYNTWFRDEEGPDSIRMSSDHDISHRKALLKAEKDRLEMEKTGIKEHAQLLPQLHEKSGLWIPPITVSCLRLSSQRSSHFEILPKAVENGLNLIETSSIYPESQFVLAESMKEFPSPVSRKNLILLSKIGFETKETPLNIQIVGHKLDVDFLREELTKSLARMGVSCLDFLLIQQPEQAFRHTKLPEDIYNQLEKAFQWLESEVAEGRISHYGVSSGSFIKPADHPYFLSLEEILKRVRKVNGDNNHFSVIQLPFNLYENGYITEKNQSNGTLSVSQVAKNEGIASIPYRPLRDANNLRFIQYPCHEDKDIVQLLKEGFDVCMLMEASYKETAKEAPNLPKFEEMAIAHMIAQGQERYEDLAVWKDTIDNTIIPYRTRVFNQLVEKKPDAAEWITKYMIATDKLMDRITLDLERKNAHEAKGVEELLQDFPSLSNNPLETKAMRVALSTGAESISVGIRDVNLIHNNLKMLRYDPIPSEELENLLLKVKQWRDTPAQKPL